MGHSMYYTEQEPPIESIGKKRHFFGKPSQKGQSQGNLSMTRQDEGQQEAHLTAEIVSLVQRLLSTKGVRSNLEINFKNADFA